MQKFPFLSLPLELQLIVLKQIDEITTLKDVLTVPEVLGSVSSLLKYVTNFGILGGPKRPRITSKGYFQAVSKSLTRTRLEDLVVSERSSRNSNGMLHIVDIQCNESLTVQDLFKLLELKDMFIAITAGSSRFCGIEVKSEENEYIPLSPFLGMCHDLGNCSRAVGVFIKDKYSYSNHHFKDQWTLWPRNLTVDGLARLSVRSSLKEMDELSVVPKPIRFTGALGYLELTGSATGATEQRTKALIERYSQLIKAAGSVLIRIDDESALGLDGIDLQKLTGLFTVYNCHSFKNSSIKGEIQYDNIDLYDGGCSSFELHTSPQCTPEGTVSPLIENVSASGVQTVILHITELFPIFKNVQLPDVQSIAFCRDDQSHQPLKISSVKEDMEELSKVIAYTDTLLLDRFTVGVLPELCLNAFNALKILCIFDIPCLRGSAHKPLQPRRGQRRVCLPNLQRLYLHSGVGYDQLPALDTNRFSSIFEFPRLYKFTFKSICRRIELKSMAQQFPEIKGLTISGVGPHYDHNDHSPEYQSPYIGIRSTRSPKVFHKLLRMSISPGYFRDMFKEVSFPVLKSLDIQLNVRDLRDMTFEADMPKLDSLVLTVYGPGTFTAQPIIVSGFPLLRNLSHSTVDGYDVDVQVVNCPLVQL